MILYHHFISLVLVSIVRCHELFSLLSLDNILSFTNFHLGLMIIIEQREQQVMEGLVPLGLIELMVMAIVVVFIIINHDIHLNCNYVHVHLLLFFLLLLVYLPIFLQVVSFVIGELIIKLCFYYLNGQARSSV